MTELKPGSRVQGLERLLEGAPDVTDTREVIDAISVAPDQPLIVRSAHTPTGVTGPLSAGSALLEAAERDDSRDSISTENAAVGNPDQAPRKATPVASVLILEDTTELAEVIQATLERLNMQVAIETHGGKALSHYETVKPDVVLLDLGLPDMNGWKFLEAVKEKYKTQLPIIIVITAYGDPANRLVGKLQGVYDYLIKPFTSDEVERVVTGALSTRSSG
jgi:CheY-like chemotaxis protein